VKGLDREAKSTGRTKSKIAREALRRQVAARCRALLSNTLPFAEAQGLVTDEDVFRVLAAGWRAPNRFPSPILGGPPRWQRLAWPGTIDRREHASMAGGTQCWLMIRERVSASAALSRAVSDHYL